MASARRCRNHNAEGARRAILATHFSRGLSRAPQIAARAAGRVTALPLRALGAGEPHARYARSNQGEINEENDWRLQRGMTEQEGAQLEGEQAPDRIIMRTYGTATPNPFPCKVHVYRRGLWSVSAVVFEDVRGKWVASRWL